MANTFLAAVGADLGKSLREDEMLDKARDILIEAETQGCRVILPGDGRVARAFEAGAAYETVALGPDTVLDEDQMVLDAGDAAVADVVAEIKALKTLVWNGPLGAFEIAPFDTATVAAARAAAAQPGAGALVTVAGGGDAVAALNAAGASDAVS